MWHFIGPGELGRSLPAAGRHLRPYTKDSAKNDAASGIAPPQWLSDHDAIPRA